MRLLPVRLRREHPRGAIVAFEFAPHVLDHEVRFYFVDAWSGPSLGRVRNPNLATFPIIGVARVPMKGREAPTDQSRQGAS
jgi:hypothetical protein